MRKGLAFVVSLLFVFSLVHALASSDPCPLHGRDHPHGLGASVASQGLVCHCFVSFFCDPPFSGSLSSGPVTRLTKVPYSDRFMSLWVLEIFHPPRALLTA